MVDRSIGPYKILREIGEQAFQAVDSTRKRQVMIKSLEPDAANRSEVEARLYSEAKTLALLNHPNIARIIGFMRASDRFYLVMEYVEGKNLQSILKEKGRLDPNLALAIFHQIVAAVKFAHELGVVHGDLKPSNVMVSSFAQIKVLDFAIAPILGNLSIDYASARSGPYTAPERIKGGRADARSDIYSLGVLLYESIVGSCPNTRQEAHRAAAESTPLPPSLLVGNCPPWLDGFFLRTLATSPGDRFQSVAAMLKAMGAAVPARNRKTTAKSVRPWVDNGFQRLSTGRSILFARSRGIIGAISASLDNAARRAAEKRASAATFLRKSVLAVNPWTLTKRGASKTAAWAGGIRLPFSSPTIPSRIIFQNPKEFFAGFPKTNRKGYAVLATFLAALFMEFFIFGGANSLYNPDFNSITALTRTGATQSFLEPLDPGPSPAVDLPLQAEPQPKEAKRVNREPRQSDRTNSKADGLHHEALNSRRTVTYRADAANAPNHIVAQEVKASEPSKRSPEANAPLKPQLNVRWEN